MNTNINTDYFLKNNIKENAVKNLKIHEDFDKKK